jgi:hypothetical protein
MTSLDHHLPASTLADLFDTAFRLYRSHVALLCRASGRSLALALAIHLLLTNLLGLWLSALIVTTFSMAIVLSTLVPLTIQIADLSTHPPVHCAPLSFPQRLSIVVASIIQLLLLLLPFALLYAGVLLLDEIHKNDPPGLGSADTPYEQNLICLVMLFTALYPLLAVFVVSACRIFAPMIALERVGPLRALTQSWTLTSTAWRQSLLTTLLILVTHLITQLPLLTLWWLLPDNHEMFQELLGRLIISGLLFVGLMLALPLEAMVSILLFDDLRVRWKYSSGSEAT